MFVAYVYNIQGNLIAQIEDFVGVDVNLVMSDTSSATLKIFHDNPNATPEILKKMNGITLTQNINGKEREMFRGIIRGLEINLNEITIYCVDKTRLLGKRILRKSYDFHNKSVEHCLNTVRSDLNNVYSIGLNLVIDAKDIVERKEHAKKTTLLGILKERNERGYQFRLYGDDLVFGKNVGRDRTQGELYKAYIYDINTPDDNTILSAMMTDDAKDIINNIMDEKDRIYQNQDSIQTFGMLEEAVHLDGKPSDEFLAETKNGTQIYEVDGKVDNFFDVELGDFVYVYVKRNNALMNYDGTMQIIEKKYEGGDLQKVSYKFSSEKSISKTFFDKIRGMEEDIKNLKLKIN